MAQSGLHALAGAYIARAWVKTEDSISGRAKAGGLKLGVVLGALLPDVDFFLLGPLYLFNTTLAVTMHRSFTHSLLFTLVIVGVVWLMAHARRSDHLKSLAWGLGVGILSHMVLDVAMWFGGIQWLWPLGYVGVPQELNLWRWLTVPREVSNLLGALDYLCFGLYYVYLGRAARRLATDQAFLGRLGWFTRLQWVLTVVFIGLAFVLGGWFDVAHYALFIVFFFPLSLYVTVKMRATIYGL